ncbi:MAG: HAD family phosphatase [Pseudomonadota bacterium]|uniref:HAD family hydrolase n=1 Tax=unclassified Polaromonas TaxID=2638319 RepID=UPI000BC5C69C|nr:MULTISPECIES: HAD family phosphatase [unclassified Polaromonas]OYY35742.1 MAG: HAD family hydrolase [Polaromonas sp. 35-63-35]OYZ19954.1 MAG: HAD family hydrolase [Polaromonas sp. 16-63-31]OYZ76829.1 MAG: HAD family hydrolase [Polaromonas sp. 24-63-21]OZA51896.1 MAG: HAD family hydrolase [Polaromonas sp. 17-63-33]OZA88072.1 MAG: HAD family hydrolase [Polaromonas sp. 39-63-25]
MKFEAVLFDCDGVLVDSEPITNGVLRDMLEEAGWALSSAECMRLFIGKAVKDQAALIEANTGRPLTQEWLHEFRGRRNEALVEGLLPIRGAVEAVTQIHTLYEGRIACASGADRFKVDLQLEKCGLMPFFKGHIFSGHELPRSKPAPDVYLAAAASLGVDPKRCAVVEDTVTGVAAGVAAGATVFGYSPPEAGHDAPDALLKAGAVHIFVDMTALPALLG